MVFRCDSVCPADCFRYRKKMGQKMSVSDSSHIASDGSGSGKILSPAVGKNIPVYSGEKFPLRRTAVFPYRRYAVPI